MKSAAGITFYVDNVSVFTATLTGTNTFTNAGVEARLGSDKADGTIFYNGLLAAVSVYNTALTAGQIFAHYKAGSGFKLLVDGSAITTSGAGTSSGIVTLTTTQSNDIIVLEALSSVLAGTLANLPVLSVSGGGLIWQKRKAVQDAVSGNGSNTELWWALAASPLTAAAITVTFTGSLQGSILIAFGVNGCSLSNPRDPNGEVTFRQHGWWQYVDADHQHDEPGRPVAGGIWARDNTCPSGFPERVHPDS